MKQLRKVAISFSLLTCITLTSCVTAQLDRMEWLGKEPPMTKPEIKVESSTPINWPEYDDSGERMAYITKNSLWDKNSNGYFKDTRARNIGDILTVKIRIDDRAELDNRVQRRRQDNDTAGIQNLYGLEEIAKDLLPGGNVDPANLVNRTGNMINLGEGFIDRREVIETSIAAVVTKVLPSGNLVVYGSQELRVNYEVRQLTLQGVIRPQDISPQNDIDYAKVAEARVSYGGKGIIMDIQQPRIGSQLADIVGPF